MINYDLDALEYISKLCDGHLRDAITLMDKCLAYSPELSLQNVITALGSVDYDTMFQLTECFLGLVEHTKASAIKVIEDLYNSGKDLKLFVRQYVQFLLDLCKYRIGCDWKYITLPKLEKYETWLKECEETEFNIIERWLSVFVNLNSDLKWSTTVKVDIEATIMCQFDRGVML